ncbi:hypothetical protein NM208_g13382 [Fusarium decemcellulare]|uniref:Uncharacterized protein n=1 Tax=Fusarium decemcellulare TaxID=57161 RepID=A0ACC1RK42_9HYPO|nr:hypothetical protein NM208_g13382 [Fusarium decemcellulare]
MASTNETTMFACNDMLHIVSHNAASFRVVVLPDRFTTRSRVSPARDGVLVANYKHTAPFGRHVVGGGISWEPGEHSGSPDQGMVRLIKSEAEEYLFALVEKAQERKSGDVFAHL